MMGKKEEENKKLYYYGFSLSERIPKDHPLRIIKKAIDFNFVYKEVKDSYNLIGAFEYKLFNRLRISEKINKKWDYISSLLKQAT